MQDIIDFINKNHAGHSHLAITVRVLQCLAYIETHIEEIAAYAGEESLLHDPGSKLPFHIADYPTPDVARVQLLKLAHDVRSTFHDLMAIEDEELRHEAVSTFLNNISDSNAGCMEARLRPALVYAARYQDISKDKEEESFPVDTSILFQDDCVDKLTNDQISELRNRIRANAKKFSLKGDFVIKALRADELYFVRQFTEMVAPPHIKHPLRRKLKCYFTVTGAGIFQRQGTQYFPDVPMKTPQFTEAEKQGFSKTQSSSFGWEHHHPNVFGFVSRCDKLVGVLVESQNFLLTDRLFIYDNGTLYRPYDHAVIGDAKIYCQEKCNRLLFRSADVDKFKAAILRNKNKKYNEAMVRMRWGTDGTSKCFVASDTMEARIVIQDNARIKKQHLVANGLMDASQTIPICYYFPDQPDLHLKEYTEAEQRLDRLMVQHNYRTDASFIQSLSFGYRYGLLLALPPESIIHVFKQEYSLNKLNIILVMMSEGYIHIVISLLEKVPEHKEAILQIILDELRLEKHHHLFWNILFHCLRTKFDELADRIILQTPEDISKRVDPEITHFMDAAEFGYEKFIRLAVQHVPSLSNKKHEGETGLIKATRKNHYGIVRILLTVNIIDVNATNNDGSTALTVAAVYGYNEIINALLQHKLTRVDIYDKRTHCAITMAAMSGHRDTVKILLAHNEKMRQMTTLDRANTLLHLAVMGRHLALVEDLLRDPRTEINKRNSIDNTALDTAVLRGYTEIVTALLAHSRCRVNSTNKYLETVLIVAAGLNHVEILKILLAHPKIEVNERDKDGLSALMWAVRNGQTESVKLLLQHKDIDVLSLRYAHGLKCTALAYAAQNRQYDAFEMLLFNLPINIDLDEHGLVYEELEWASRKPDFAKRVRKYLFEYYLPNYIERREAQDDYKTFYGRLFGEHKDVKLAAARALIKGEDLTNHQAAFNSGELKCVYTLLVNCGKTLAKDILPVVHNSKPA